MSLICPWCVGVLLENVYLRLDGTGLTSRHGSVVNCQLGTPVKNMNFMPRAVFPGCVSPHIHTSKTTQYRHRIFSPANAHCYCPTHAPIYILFSSLNVVSGLNSVCVYVG